jgi:hypothetical protein
MGASTAGNEPAAHGGQQRFRDTGDVRATTRSVETRYSGSGPAGGPRDHGVMVNAAGSTFDFCGGVGPPGFHTETS